MMALWAALRVEGMPWKTPRQPVLASNYSTFVIANIDIMGKEQHEGERNIDEEDMDMVCIIIVGQRVGRNFVSFCLALDGDGMATAFFLHQKFLKLPFSQQILVPT